MSSWTITSKTSGADLGTYEAETWQGALDAMSRQAGYADHAAACRESGDDGAHLVVVQSEVSDRDIESLRREAQSAGDMVQVVLCDVALETYDVAGGLEAYDMTDATAIACRRRLEALGIVIEHVGAEDLARAECETAIRAARAQSA